MFGMRKTAPPLRRAAISGLLVHPRPSGLFPHLFVLVLADFLTPFLNDGCHQTSLSNAGEPAAYSTADFEGPELEIRRRPMSGTLACGQLVGVKRVLAKHALS